MSQNKNLILAVVLCLIVLLGWGRFAEFMGWQQPAPQAPAPEAPAPAPVQAPVQTQPTPVFTPSPGHDILIDTPLYKATLYSGGGTLRSFTLKKYHSGILPDSPLVNMISEQAAAYGPLGLVINGAPSWSSGQWSVNMEDTNFAALQEKPVEITINGIVDNLNVERRLNFSASDYVIREKLVISNPGAQTRSTRVRYTQAMDGSIASGGQYDSMRIAWDEDGSLVEESSTSSLQEKGATSRGTIYWAGPMSTYFLAASLPAIPNGATVMCRLERDVYRVALEQEEFLLNPGQSREIEVSYWIGPKDRAQMAEVSEQLVKSVDLGFFSGIGKFLLWLLEFFYKYVHNWGIAIILLTCLIKGAFWPLTAKSYASMEKMKALQPIMQKIREKNKGNREAINKETMALYKTYKVNPASGCVPILVQLPVFFGLYQALLSSIALRHASFITYLPGTDIIWLADLSAKDPLYITPIVMGLTMFLQQKMSPPPGDPMQRKIMMFLPLIFTVLFLNFPSGLVLYWLVNNILSIFQQWLHIRKSHAKKSGAPQPVPINKTNRK